MLISVVLSIAAAVVSVTAAGNKGEPCSGIPYCADGLVCLSTTNICASFVPTGTKCDSEVNVCNYDDGKGDLCFFAFGSTSGICTPITDSDRCKSDSDCSAQLSCNTEGVCVIPDNQATQSVEPATKTSSVPAPPTSSSAPSATTASQATTQVTNTTSSKDTGKTTNTVKSSAPPSLPSSSVSSDKGSNSGADSFGPSILALVSLSAVFAILL